MKLAIKILGYLKKYPKRGYIISSKSPVVNLVKPENKKIVDFGLQYSYFEEDIDPEFPDSFTKELPVTIFCDSDHGHDKVTGRSITGIIVLVGSTPVLWESKRQSSVQLSTYGAEFVALKRAITIAEDMRYTLRSMGVEVKNPTVVFEDNQSVCISSTNPGTTLNHKNVALAYHYVREHQANKVVEIVKIPGVDNYADAFTKGLNSTIHGDHIHNLMSN